MDAMTPPCVLSQEPGDKSSEYHVEAGRHWTRFVNLSTTASQNTRPWPQAVGHLQDAEQQPGTLCWVWYQALDSDNQKCPEKKCPGTGLCVLVAGYNRVRVVPSWG